ncbi:MAG: DNA glycosylase, partial [Candidatus Limnocylindrales bacterium]
QARVSPWTPVRALDLVAVAGLVDLAREILRQGAATGRRPRHVYRRAGRPCPRCRTVLSVAHQGTDLPRLTFWCPACQPDPRSTP